jgi:excisionase family DNA binding protein
MRKTNGGWSTGRLATHVGMSYDFIRAEIRLGELKASRFGREWRIEIDEVRRYCRKHSWPEPPAESAAQAVAS